MSFNSMNPERLWECVYMCISCMYMHIYVCVCVLTDCLYLRVVLRVSRSGDIIEPLLKKQWFVRCDEMAQRAVQVGRWPTPHTTCV